MKKGFTLIELLGVIVIIGILALITVPAVDGAIKKGKLRAYEATKDTIMGAAKNWLTDNKILFDDGDTLTLTIADLKEQGYLDFDIKNPSSGACLDNTMEVSITRSAKKYSYAIVDEELVDGTENDCAAVSITPSIYLLGDNPLNVEINTSFVDPGAKAMDTDGNDISDNIITPGIINTSVLANNIKYKYTILSNGATKTITRKVNVVDTTAPVITIPDDTYLGDEITVYNLTTGVSATDNSGETVNISVKSNLSLGVVGKYTVTYIATDSSGNISKATREITIEHLCYTFDDTTGTISSYNWEDSKCSRSVIIPAYIDDVAVKYIDEGAFVYPNMEYDVLAFYDKYAGQVIVDLAENSGLYWQDYAGNSSYRLNLALVDSFGGIDINETTKKCYYSGGTFDVKDINYVVLPSEQYIYCDIDIEYEDHIVEESLKSVDLSNATELISIGEWAFWSNKNLEYVYFSANGKLETIYQGAFSSCAIKNVSLPASLITIGANAFRINEIENVVFGGNEVTFGKLAFYLNNISSITIPATVNNINDWAFGTNSIKNVIIKNKTSSTQFTTYGSQIYGWDNSVTCVKDNTSNVANGCITWNG